MAKRQRQLKRRDHVRILMYSHDTFGLGHLRRCRAIAHALVERVRGLHVLIISGSPIAGAFDFRVRVDFVKIPSVIKLHNGEYKSMSEHIELDETLDMRRSMIRDTARTFDPDIFIVDKEPLGLNGELLETLHELNERDCSLVLGLRDVMDSPEQLAREWAPKHMLEQIDALYQHIWVYGPEDFWNPLTGLDAPESLNRKLTYTGFLHRTVPYSAMRSSEPQGDFILVTTGGGGDGAELLRDVLAAYEGGHDIPFGAVFVLGPFMPADDREEIARRAARTGRVEVIDFDNHIERLITAASAFVGMGGYNSFCEVLSFDKRALIVPRTRPRKEQLVRATRGAELGLVSMLHPDQARHPEMMAGALRAVIARPRPSAVGVHHMMNGLETIGDLVEDLIRKRNRPPLSVVKAAPAT